MKLKRAFSTKNYFSTKKNKMNSFGRLFRIHIFGESHGDFVGITIDGCPAGIPLVTDDFMPDIKRRQAGAAGTTPRIEADLPILATGVFKEKTTGAPLTILFKNENTKSKDYEHLTVMPRPGHADFVGMKKFGTYNDYRGGGHFSGRLTLALVAAGVVAKKILQLISVQAHLTEVNGNKNIEEEITRAIQKQDSVGGIVECTVQNMPIGLGEPFFDSIESVLSHAIFSIPAIKGIEFGSGFAATKMTGSNHNDALIDAQGTTKTNHAGGINGGISNGNQLAFKVAVKPTASTPQIQQTMNLKNQQIENLDIKGRHDLCIALRVPVVVENVTAFVLADFLLLEQQRKRIQ